MKKKLFLILFILFMFSPKNVLATSEKEGWIRESNGYTYYYRDGEMLKGLYVIDGNKYHFGELSGQLKKGWSITLDKREYLGEYLDIHGGGVDNIFPHHTNEIAQSESYLGHKWCNYWFHNEHLNDESGKMSKSHGAILTVSLLKEKGYNPLSFRYMCLLSHYRKQLTFSFDSLEGAENAYKKLKSKTSSLKFDDNIDENEFNSWKAKFVNCLEDDLNTANAITVLYDLLKSDVNMGTKYRLVSDFDEVLSLDLLKNETKKIENEDEILAKINERNEAKKNKNYEKADKIREELLNMGIVIKDTREGTTYEAI